MIPHLEDLSIAQRIVLTATIVMIVLLLIGAVGFLGGRWEVEGQELSPPISKYEARLAELELEALDDAFKKHMVRLYDIWVTDYTPHIPPRAIKGARNARDAYERYRLAVEKRQETIGRDQRK
jgi:hypothetical protein